MVVVSHVINPFTLTVPFFICFYSIEGVITSASGGDMLDG